MRSPLPFPGVPDRPYKILLAQVGTLSFSHPLFGVFVLYFYLVKKRKKTDNPREGWENGTPPPHRDFKERSVMR